MGEKIFEYGLVPNSRDEQCGSIGADVLSVTSSSSSRQPWWKCLRCVRGKQAPSRFLRNESSWSTSASTWSRPMSSVCSQDQRIRSFSSQVPGHRPRTSSAVNGRQLDDDWALFPAVDGMPARPQTSPSSTPKTRNVRQDGKVSGDRRPQSTAASYACPESSPNCAEDTIASGPGRPHTCGRRSWTRTFQELMEAYWSLDLGALMTTGGVITGEDGPSQRRKDLQAFFRGRILMTLCEQDESLMQKCLLRGPQECADELANVTSNPQLQSQVLSMEDLMWTATPRTASSPHADAFRFQTLADIASDHTSMAQSPSQKEGADHPETTHADTPDVYDADTSMKVSDTEAFPLPTASSAKGERRTSGKPPASSIISGPPLPQLPKKKPRPLSLPSVAGATWWAETAEGCLVEIPSNPKAHSERQARSRAVRKRRETQKVSPVTITKVASLRQQAEAFYGGDKLERKPAIPKQRRTIKVEPPDLEECNSDGSRSSYHDGHDDSAQRNRKLLTASTWLSDEESVYGSVCDEVRSRQPSPYVDSEESPPSQRHNLRRGSTVQQLATGMHSHSRSRPRRSMTVVPSCAPLEESKEQTRKDTKEIHFRNQVSLSRRFHIPLEEIKESEDLFNSFDSSKEGGITMDEFKSLVRQITKLPEDQPIPFHLMQRLPCRQKVAQTLDDCQPTLQREDGRVSFEDFLHWMVSCEYSEEMMVRDPKERHIRQLARDRKMLITDVEKIKSVFDNFDTDGSGEIEQAEFRHILCKLMGVANEKDVSELRLHRYWRELDSDNDGAIAFEEFLSWYCKSFKDQL